MKAEVLGILVAGLLAGPIAAHATALVVSDGLLVGASGVSVNGKLYDVEFLDGTCLEIFEGCDSASDFVFSDEATARLAAQALFAQVLLDGEAGLFDSAATLTRGCVFGPLFDLCVMATPFLAEPERVFTAKAYNFGGGHDSVGVNAYERDNDFEDVYTTWARWSVPEPGTAELLGLGIACLGLARHRRVH